MKNFFKKSAIFSLIFIFLIYILGLILFSIYTYPNTTINGIDRSFINKTRLFDLSDQKFGLTIVDRDNKSYELESSFIGYQKTVVGSPKDQSKVFLWPIEVFQDHDYEIEISNIYDKPKLSKFISDNKFLEDMIDPQDAKIEYIKESDSYILVDEVEGTRLDKNKLEQAIVNSINEGKDTLYLSEIYDRPKLTTKSPQLIDRFNKINEISSSKYDFDFVDNVVSLTGKELFEMYDEIDDEFILNKDKTRKWIADLARQTDTYGKDREFNATDLGTITVKGGIYGFLMAVDSTNSNLVKMIEDGIDGKVDIEYLVEGPYREKDDIKGTYIELDISRQHMWFYKDGKLFMESDVVTGNMINKDSMTPIGLNKIWSKSRKKVLKGVNPNTGQAYEYPTEYFMPMGWTDSGFHDTYTRDTYGGDIYLTAGSSACVNMPLEKAKLLYENVELEAPVFVYESAGDKSPTELDRQIFYRTGQWPDV